MRRMVLRATVALLTIALAGPLFSRQAGAATKLTLLYTAGANNLGGYVAKDQGFFEKHGLDAELINATLVAP